MRTYFAVKNTIASIFVEIIAAISGIILPKFFTGAYGSSINGLVSSIGQFITYMGLVEAGVSAAATVELYKPLADKNHDRINEIVSAAKGFYFRSGIIFIGLDIILIIGYPYIVKNEITDISFIRVMIAVLSLSGIVDYFLLGKYRVLLVADQKTYIIAIAQAIGTLVILVISVVLIKLNCSAIIVKAVVGVVYFLRTVFIVIYVRSNYKYLNLNVRYSSDAFPQRKSALFHQVIGMICNNTDIVLLTLMLKENALVEVSVYSAYNMVAYNLTALFNSISKGVGATFGNIIAQDDKNMLNKGYGYFELFYFILLFIIYTCMGILLYSFIFLYSFSFPDADVYTRWSLVALFTMCGIVQNIRTPGSTVQIAAGHFKQTQGAALLEAIINLGVSIALIGSMGINGVLIGTLAAYLYRSSYVIIYNDHHFVSGTLQKTAFRVLRNGALCGLLIVLGLKFVIPLITSWFLWVAFAIASAIIVGLLFFLLNYLFEPLVIKECLQYARKLIKGC